MRTQTAIKSSGFIIVRSLLEIRENTQWNYGRYIALFTLVNICLVVLLENLNAARFD